MGFELIAEISNFYQGKKVFLTGHTGFKGTWLSIWLDSMGAVVCGYSLAPPDESNFFSSSGIEGSITSILGDIRDRDCLKDAVAKFDPDIVVHMAAQSLVKKSYQDAIETYATNVMGTVNLLETIRTHRTVAALVNVTSDKCYEDRNWLRGYREDDPLGGHDPYSSSKACSEIITSAYIRSFFSGTDAQGEYASIATARAGNVIGGGDFAADRLIPDMIRSFFKKKPAHIRNPHAIRPWQYVLEPLVGYLILAKKLVQHGTDYSGAWNFGPQCDELINVESVVEKFIDMWGDDATWEAEGSGDGKQAYEASLLKLDSSKAQHLLGWKTRLNIDQAISWTVDWYEIFRDSPERILEYSKSQIKKYERILNEIF
jgi:CDP-glucose 4,6-dehydratase